MIRRRAVLGLPLVLVPLQLSEGIRSVLIWLIEALTEGFFAFLGTVFTELTSAFLFPRNPRELVRLNNYYDGLLILFIIILLLGGGIFLVYMQLFPGSSDADPWRVAERALAGILLVVLGKWIIGTSVWLTNVIGQSLMPDTYSLDVVTGGWGALLGFGDAAAELTLSTFSGLILAVFGGTSTFFTLATFFTVLGMRMLAIYVLYGLFPLLVGLWIFDMGILKYGAQFARFAFKVTAFLLIIGIVISGILATGNAVAGAGNTDLFVDLNNTNGSGGGSLSIAGPARGGQFQTDGGNANDSVNATAERVAETPGGAAGVMTRMLAYIGSLWLSVALTMSGLGVMISTGGGGGRGGGGRKPVAQSRSSPAGGSGVRRDRGGAATGSTIGATAATTASDDTTGGTGGVLDASVTGDRLEDVPVDDLSLSRKASTAAEGVASSAASGAGRVTGHVPDSVTDSVESGAERFQDVTDSVGDSSPARAASWGYEQTAPYAQAAGRTAKGVAKTYGRMFAEEDPVRSAQIGLNAMRRSPVGDPRRSNVTGSTIDSSAGSESVEKRHGIDLDATARVPTANSDYPRLVEDESDQLRDSLAEKHGKEAVDRVYDRIETVKQNLYRDESEVARQTNEQLAADALDLPGGPRNGGDLAEDVTADEIAVYRDLNEVSKEFAERHYGDEFAAYRGLSHGPNTAGLIAQAIDNPDADSFDYELPSVSKYTDTVAEASTHGDVVIERDAEPDDVALATDHLIRSGLTEGELHLAGGSRSASPESLRYVDDGEAQPLMQPIDSLDNPESMTLDEHETMHDHVDRLIETRTPVDTEGGAERLENWADELGERNEIGSTEAEALRTKVEALTEGVGEE